MPPSQTYTQDGTGAEADTITSTVNAPTGGAESWTVSPVRSPTSVQASSALLQLTKASSALTEHSRAMWATLRST